MTNSKSTRRLLAVSLALTIALSLSAPAFAAVTSFSDVPASHNFHDAIMWCSSQGIVGGYEDGTFQPSKTVTRSNFIVMLSRAFYPDTAAKNQTITAYTEKGTFYPNYMALYLNLIFVDTDFNKVANLQNASFMGAGINRYEMALFMTNIMNQKGFAASDAEKSAVISKIADYASIPSQYRDAVLNVYALGIIGGYADGTFSGSGIMNRGQACVVIYRMMQYSGSDSVAAPTPVTPVDPGTTEPDSGNTTEPSTPETPTLRDGTAVTEENVLNRIQEILKVYPSGTPWGNNTRRNDSVSIGGYELGAPSKAVMTLETKYAVSMHEACGGFAGLVSDAIFGGSTTGGDNFPIRQLDSVSQIRPGDILCKMNANGHITHYLTAASGINTTKDRDGTTIYGISTYEGNTSDVVVYSIANHYVSDTLYKDAYYIAYTRYPD